MPFTPQEALARVIVHREIFYDEMVELMRQVMGGEVSPLMTAALLIGLRVKKETVGEIAGAAAVMREFAAKVEVADRSRLVDIVGTGGDSAHTFNISTASMFVCAAAGACVAKHGNRSVSSKSGSADVLEALGACIELQPAAVADCIARTGLGFMYAPIHHPAMRNVAPVRKELGVRTLFNILGPLTNPAGAPNILMGVFHPDLVGIQARVLQRLGAKRALVVHGRDGLDEITLSGATLVAELRHDRIEEYEILPGEFGLSMADASVLRVDGPEQSRQVVLDVLADKDGPARDIVLLNSGAALYAAGVAASIGDGIDKARIALASGSARAKLDAYVAVTRRLGALPSEHA
jgi:anthranilate phosphoribosyltransferase